MKIFYGTNNLPYMDRPKATIGIFDGIHIGHKKLLNSLVKKAHRKHKKAIVITFAPHPYRVLYPKKTPPMILSLSHRLKLLERMKIDAVLVLSFNKHFSRQSPETFTRGILVRRLNIGELFVGDNFRLGYGRKGKLSLLKKLSSKYGFKLNMVRCKKIRGRAISSTLIRRLITEGKLKEASRRMGRNVSILGTVVKGDKRGRIIGFPTSNLDLHHEAVPASGVYASLVRLNGKLHKGILNIGFRPTFKQGKKERTVEVYIFNFKKNLYGKDIEVIFIKKIRRERHFTNKEHLREQIKRDIERAKRILSP